MNKQIANKLIKALYGKVESLRAEAHWVKGTKQECDLVRKALVILKRIDSEINMTAGEIQINGKTYKACKLKMVEIYGGKDPDWKGWHNLILDLGGPEFDKAIAGPIDPETSQELILSIKYA